MHSTATGFRRPVSPPRTKRHFRYVQIRDFFPAVSGDWLEQILTETELTGRNCGNQAVGLSGRILAVRFLSDSLVTGIYQGLLEDLGILARGVPIILFFNNALRVNSLRNGTGNFFAVTGNDLDQSREGIAAHRVR